MKILTKFVYVAIFIFSAIYVFKHQKYSKRIEIIDGYCDNFSVNRGQDLEFYLNAQVDHKQGVVCIYNVNNEIVDSLVLNLIKQKSITDTLLYKNGYKYTNKYSYNTAKLNSGIYFLGKVVPFIVKEPSLKNNITIVFPFANFIALSNVGGKSFEENNSSHGVAAKELSINRLPYFRNSPFAFIQWMNKKYQHQNINYISDLDLEDSPNLENTDLLVLYGYQGFWTIKERKNLDHYLDQGRNLLAICSNLINNKITFNNVTKQLLFLCAKTKNVKNKEINWNKFYPNTKSIGCSIEICYDVKKLRNSQEAYVIIRKNHPIFNGIEVDSIKMETQNGNAIAVIDSSFETIPQPNRKINNFLLNEILAYDFGKYKNKQTITGIFNFKKNEKSGEIIIIGNEKWCYPQNIENEVISKITSNCIHFLSKKQRAKIQ